MPKDQEFERLIKDGRHRLISEEIEPTMARLVGAMFARCEIAKASGDQWQIEGACCNMWWVVKGINKIAVGLTSTRKPNEADCVHFSIAAGNEVSRVQTYITDLLGYDPTSNPGWN